MKPFPDVRDAASLADIHVEFAERSNRERLLLLAHYAREYPGLVSAIAPEGSLQVESEELCAEPFRLWVDTAAEQLTVYAEVPASLPTMRGFVAILARGLAGVVPQQAGILSRDYPYTLGLTETLSPIRVHNMATLAHRVRQAIEHGPAKIDTRCARLQS